MKHNIDIGNFEPCFNKHYKLPRAHSEEILNQITDMMENNIIEAYICRFHYL